MTQEEIKEGNRIIAESLFSGLKEFRKNNFGYKIEGEKIKEIIKSTT